MLIKKAVHLIVYSLSVSSMRDFMHPSFLATLRQSIACAILSILITAPAFAQNSQPAPRPMVVLVHAQGCKQCEKVKPSVDELEKEYKNRADFVELEVTDSKSTKQARKRAKELGVSFFLSFYEDNFPAVGIFDERRKCVKEMYGFNKKEDYKAALDAALKQSAKPGSTK